MTNIKNSDTQLSEIDKQAAVIREGIKSIWGARKTLAERLNVSESTIRRHLMEGSGISENIRLQTISIGAKMLIEIKEESEKMKKQILEITPKAN